jgi:heme/copper-type cytochrome/quinol oxidase subunit 2
MHGKLNSYTKTNKVLLVVAMMVFSAARCFAQIPQNYPDAETKPLEINLYNILLYVVAPVIIIIAYFMIRRRSRKN